MPGRRPIHVLFITEQILGHISFAQNLRAELDQCSDLQVKWRYVNYLDTGLAAHMPLLRNQMALRGSLQALKRIGAAGVPIDVLVFHTQTIVQLAWPLMLAIPTIISLDATQENYASLGTAYGHAGRGDSFSDRAVKRLNRTVFRTARALLPWSSWAANSLTSHYAVDPSAVVINPPGLDLTRWQPRADLDVRQRVRLLFVGGDFERKGGRLLLEALSATDSDWELHVVPGTDVSSKSFHGDC